MIEAAQEIQMRLSDIVRVPATLNALCDVHTTMYIEEKEAEKNE